MDKVSDLWLKAKHNQKVDCEMSSGESANQELDWSNQLLDFSSIFK